MAWFSPDWNYGRKITISPTNVDETLVNFPVYVPYGGGDYRFTASDGSTQLDHTTYNASSYVKIPSISSTGGAEFYMYWGNSAASDDSTTDAVADYIVFAPLRNSMLGTDLSPSGLSVTSGGTVVPKANGVDITSGWLEFGVLGNLQSLLNGASGCTYSAVARDVTFVTFFDYLSWEGNADMRMEWFLRSTEPRARFRPNSGEPEIDVRGSAISGANHHAAFTYRCYDGTPTTLTNYNNGVVNGSGTSASTTTSLSLGTTEFPIRLGAYTSGVVHSTRSTVSDFRIRKGAVSDAWVKFENANLMNSGNELSYGDVRNRIPYHIIGRNI